MGAILLAMTGLDPRPWEERFRTLAPQRDIRLWPDRLGDPADIAYACAWQAPRGLLATLAAIWRRSFRSAPASIMWSPTMTCPMCRSCASSIRDLTMRMTEYVVLHVLMHHRRQRATTPSSATASGATTSSRRRAPSPSASWGWACSAATPPRRCAGSAFASPAGAARRRRLPGIETFHGAGRARRRSLARTEILVCLLPATPATRGILRLELLRKLKRDGAAGGAYLINAGRGVLQVDADILAALDEGSLAGATLDVFATEPLPATSPLWAHPNVTVTPHNAAASDPRALVANVLRQIERFEAGLPLEHVIDRAAGY